MPALKAARVRAHACVCVFVELLVEALQGNDLWE